MIVAISKVEVLKDIPCEVHQTYQSNCDRAPSFIKEIKVH